MRKIQIGDELAGMTASSCCGQAPRRISIGLTDADLSFRYCERCESKQWFRNGQPASLTSVKAMATAEWNKNAR